MLARASKSLVLAPFLTTTRYFHLTPHPNINVGDPIPDAELLGHNATDIFRARDFFAPYKKALVIGVPGAFTPGCSKTHLPGYLQQYHALHTKGVDIIACISVNDRFVMAAWGDSLGVREKITLLADPKAEWVQALGLEFDALAIGGIRSKRFAMVLENGIVKKLFVEPNNTGLSVSLAESVLEHL